MHFVDSHDIPPRSLMTKESVAPSGFGFLSNIKEKCFLPDSDLTHVNFQQSDCARMMLHYSMYSGMKTRNTHAKLLHCSSISEL